MKAIWANIILSIGFCYPITTLGSSCQSIANRINHDINRYEDSLQNKDLSWMKLSWLQKMLGAASEKENAPDMITYKWHCEDSGYVQVTVNGQGDLRNISGQYSSDNGSGLFNSKLEKSADRKITTETQANQAVSTSPVINFAPEQTVAQKDCDTIVSDIYSDIHAFKNYIQDQKLAWMKLEHLTEEINTPAEITQAYQYAYHWDEFSLLLNPDGTKLTYGVAPKLNNSLEAANEQFGPAKKIDSEIIKQYAWRCPTSRGSTLTLWVADNIITSLKGNVCGIETCQPFAATLNKSKLQNNFTLAAKKIENQSTEKMTEHLQAYNEYYKINLATAFELSNDIKTRLKNYYDNLRSCSAGTYQYAVPVADQFLFNTSIIEKNKKDNRCQVNTSYQIPHIGAVKIKCLFQSQTLELFTEHEATTLATGNTSFNTENPSKIQQVMDNECNRYINGVA